MATLRWQLLDLLRQVRRQRVWWASQAPETYGGYRHAVSARNEWCCMADGIRPGDGGLSASRGTHS